MDLVFGDTAAHEEKERMRQIEAQLTGRTLGSDAKAAIITEEHAEHVV